MDNNSAVGLHNSAYVNDIGKNFKKRKKFNSFNIRAKECDFFNKSAIFRSKVSFKENKRLPFM